MSAIDDIRARHNEDEHWGAPGLSAGVPQWHIDRGVLLRVVDDQAAEITRLRNECQDAVHVDQVTETEMDLRLVIAERDAEITGLREAHVIVVTEMDRYYRDGRHPDLSVVLKASRAALYPVEPNQEEAQHGE